MTSPGESRADRHRRAERQGRAAETLAAWWLRAKGYRIAARRFRTPQGEIDLVAVRGNTLAFIEVKARRDGAEAETALGPRQRRRIADAAAAFLARRPKLAAHDIRFDAVFITPGRLPRHVPDAWRPDF